jgi:hypothetical protein
LSTEDAPVIASVRHWKLFLTILLLPWAALPPAALGAEDPPGPYSLEPARVSAPVLSGWLAHPGIVEASGIAASRLRNDLLWIINDGGGGQWLYAVGRDGSDRGKVKVENASNVDWEDLAAYRDKGEAFLLIADFGDNQAERMTKTLYFVPEPQLKTRRFEENRSVFWTRRIRFAFGDGPRDCEGIGVDVRRRKILLSTKRTQPPQVYELPLPDRNGDGPVRIAERSGQMLHIPPPSEEEVARDPRYGRFRSQPTALDISADGNRAAVMTYGNGYLYKRRLQESWTAALGRPPRLIVMPDLRQAEALCFDATGKSLFVTSEKRPAPLYRLDLLP